MGFVPQTNNIFPSLTVQENLEMGAFIDQNNINKMLEYVYDLFPILNDKKNQDAGELSGGQRQQVAVGRALMTKPKLLMLDEPSAGVSPIIMDGLFTKIKEIADQGTAVLMVEQNAKQALKISDLGFVLSQGKNLFTDSGSSLLANKEVRQAFFRRLNNFGFSKWYYFNCKLYYYSWTDLWKPISSWSTGNHYHL